MRRQRLSRFNVVCKRFRMSEHSVILKISFLSVVVENSNENLDQRTLLTFKLYQSSLTCHSPNINAKIENDKYLYCDKYRCHGNRLNEFRFYKFQVYYL